jgi:hypothetical protein
VTPRRASLILVLVCVVLYGRSVGFGFVRADDTDLVEGNAEFLSSASNIPRAFTRSFFESGSVLTDLKTYYRPLTVASFMVDAAVGGPRPAMYHVTNVLLHTLVVVLLFVWLRRSTSTPHSATNGTGHTHRHHGTGTAFAASLIFAVHPANVQTVCWIMGRNELLLAVFSLIAFGTLTGAIRRQAGVGRSFSFGLLVIHVLAFAGALFSKETGILLLPLLGLWVLLAGGPNPASAKAPAGPPKLNAKAVSRAAMGGALAVDLAVVCVWWGLRGVALAGGSAGEEFAWRTMASNAPQLFSYLEKVVFPFRLSTMPGVDRLTVGLGAVAALVLASLLGRDPGFRTLVFVVAWFLAFLAPALLVPGLPAYEHRLYVPMIGLALGFGLLAMGPMTTEGQKPIRAKSLEPKAQRLIPALTLAAVFSIISFRYSDTFRSPLAYWGRATESPSFAPIAHVNVGQLLQDMGHPRDAAAHFRRALELDSRTPKAHNNLGVALMQLGQPREAFDAFNREVALHPWNAEAHFNLGLYHQQQGKQPEAIAYWEETLRLNKYYLPAYEKLMEYYAARGEVAKAAWYDGKMRELRKTVGRGQ